MGDTGYTEDLKARLLGARTVQSRGRLRSAVGLSIKADVPGVRMGGLCLIERQDGLPALVAEVVGFEDTTATLMPLGDSEGLAADAEVRLGDGPLQICCGPALLGRVLDGLGQPADGLGPVEGTARPVMAPSPDPLARPPIEAPLPLGIRALDGPLTVGEGQRVGLFAAAGVGKSTLLSRIARHSAADVFVVCLVGERGRELRDFIEQGLGPKGRSRGVVVCAASDAPPMVRMKCPYVATTIAESFRDRGKRVLLLMDSVTRFARAAREVGLAAGEAPARRGYPPSVFAAMPRLLERAGRTEQGSITAFYTVLVEGDDMDEPVADEMRGLLDGHVVLSRALAQRGHFPAVDVPRSLSRLMDRLVSEPHRAAAERLREHLSVYEEKRDLVALGAYTPGSDPRLDRALQHLDAIQKFLRQDSQPEDFEQTILALLALV